MQQAAFRPTAAARQSSRSLTRCSCVARLVAPSAALRPAFAAAAPWGARHSSSTQPGPVGAGLGCSYVSKVKGFGQDCKLQRLAPAQSFLGVGAPEALLVGIVALVVFGPKGLAEAAKSIGGTLRAFQPTIKEVVEVSQDIKGTLEKELGLDELREAARPTVRPREPAASMDELLRSKTSVGGFQAPAPEEDEETLEAKRKASAAMAWGDQAPAPAAPAAADAPAAAAAALTPAASAAAPAPAPSPSLGTMSTDELEAELARRRAGAASSSKPAQ